MIKKLLVSVVLLIVVLGAVAYFYLDSLVTNGIEVAGSRVLGTEVSVRSASLSPLSGSGSISGLSIANVEGFNSEHAFELEEISIALNLGSIFTDVIEVESVVISQPQITYERQLTRDNIGALMDNIATPAGGEEQAAAEGESTQRIIIREFVMDDPQVNLIAASVEAPIPLPNIALNNIGEENNAATIADAMRQILAAVSTSILNSDPPVMDMIRENVEERLQESVQEVEEAVDDAVEEIGDRLRGILN